MPYRIPKNTDKRNALIGTTETAQNTYKKSFSPGVRKFFRLSYQVDSAPFFKDINNSDPSDWLLNHKEPGQSFEEFSSRFSIYTDLIISDIVPRSKQKTIYILPIGEFPTRGRTGKSTTNTLLQWLESYCDAFFTTAQVKMLKPVPLENVACNYRVNEFTGRYQLNASNILDYLRRRKTRNQDCLIAVTMIDLYPKPSWNFVFGLASTSKSGVGGVGVFSFCRYDDTFYERWSLCEDQVKRKPDGLLDYSVFTKSQIGSALSEIDGTLLLRACKVMTHEVCHMFGLKHCIWMQCLMNGSNHLEESDRRPMHLCPVCLRKLQSVLNFDVLQRYNTMFDWTSGSFVTSQSSTKSKGTNSDAESTRSQSSSASSTGSRRSSCLNNRKHARAAMKQTKKTPRAKLNGKRRTQDQTSATLDPAAPLNKFHLFRGWLLDAIDFISTDGKPGVFSSYSQQLNSLFH